MHSVQDIHVPPGIMGKSSSWQLSLFHCIFISFFSPAVLMFVAQRFIKVLVFSREPEPEPKRVEVKPGIVAKAPEPALDLISGRPKQTQYCNV